MIFWWFFSEFGSVLGSETEQNTSSKNSYFSKLWVPLGVDFSKMLWNNLVYFGNRQKQAQEEHEHNLNITRIPIGDQWGDRRRRETDGGQTEDRRMTDRGLTVERILGIRKEQTKWRIILLCCLISKETQPTFSTRLKKINALPVHLLRQVSKSGTFRFL